jgi:lipopolysaccharide biosynthesis protein
MTFEEWFEENQDQLTELLRNDQHELIYVAWLAGYEAGLTGMSDFYKDLWTLK